VTGVGTKLVAMWRAVWEELGGGGADGRADGGADGGRAARGHKGSERLAEPRGERCRPHGSETRGGPCGRRARYLWHQQDFPLLAA
jgi:hypothetical protein